MEFSFGGCGSGSGCRFRRRLSANSVGKMLSFVFSGSTGNTENLKKKKSLVRKFMGFYGLLPEPKTVKYRYLECYRNYKNLRKKCFGSADNKI